MEIFAFIFVTGAADKGEKPRRFAAEREAREAKRAERETKSEEQKTKRAAAKAAALRL